jgi:hypothetical protein
MTLTKTQTKQLNKLDKSMKEDLRKKWINGLAKTFDVFGFKAVAREIKAGRNIRGNALYGVNMAHDRFGPRYDLENKKFLPQTKAMKEKEHRFIFLINKALEGAGEMTINTGVIFKSFREKDKKFQERVKNRN